MGNCTSSKTQVHEYGFHDNSWHIEADVDDNRNHKKVGCMQSQQGAKGLNQDAAILYEVCLPTVYLSVQICSEIFCSYIHFNYANFLAK